MLIAENRASIRTDVSPTAINNSRMVNPLRVRILRREDSRCWFNAVIRRFEAACIIPRTPTTERPGITADREHIARQKTRRWVPRHQAYVQPAP